MNALGGHHEPGHRGQIDGPSVRTLSIRVALAASAIVGVAYLLIAAAVVIVVTNNMTSDVDGHLKMVLGQVSDRGGPPGGPFPGFDPSRQDPRGLPVLAWSVDSAGQATAHRPERPCPSGRRPARVSAPKP